MKHIFTLLLAIAMTASVFGAKGKLDSVFTVQQPIKLKVCDGQGKILKDSLIEIPMNWEFRHITVATHNNDGSNNYVIKFRSWRVDHPHVKPLRKIGNEKNNEDYCYTVGPTYTVKIKGKPYKFPVSTRSNTPKYFLLDNVSILKTDTAPPGKPSRITLTDLSVQSLPAKLRFGSSRVLHYPDDNNPYKRRFDVGSGINIGAAYGPRIRIDRVGNCYLDILAGFSVGSVNIDSSTTNNKCGTAKTALGLTPYGGLVFEYQKFQAGLFLGGDILTGEIGRNWAYRNQPWLGIGIGYTIFGSVAAPAGQSGKSGQQLP